jgi:sporulation protein YlmC with PRC-barrel domain
MKKLTTTFIAAVAMLALSSPLYATGEQNRTSDTQQEAGATTAQSAEDLKGMNVVSQNGEAIGSISEVRIDPQSGEVQFVTVTKGGVLGIGGEDIAVPLEAFQFDPQNELATLTVDESKLDNAPQQANKSADEFQRELESHYGISPAWEQETEIDQTQQQQLDTDSPSLQEEGKSKPEY